MIDQCSKNRRELCLFLEPDLFCFSFTPAGADKILPRDDSNDKLHNSKSYRMKALYKI